MGSSLDKELVRILDNIRENVSALQIKVGALESILLSDDKTRAEYTRLVDEQVDALIRERQNESGKAPARKLPKA
jgi:hypothetical protein